MTKAAADIPLPPHAYIPGQTPRHPEDWFDVIKASVTDAIPTLYLHETDAFIAGLLYFEKGYFWECHEVLEAVWMQTPTPSPERDLVQAIIQLANARLKLEMGKPRATLRLCDLVDAHLQRCASHGVILGQQVTRIVGQTKATRDMANNAL